MRIITTSNFSPHRKIFALRGNIERMNDPIRNPYSHAPPGEITDGDLNYLTQNADESGMSGSSSVGGTRARKGFPRGISAREDEYDTQSEREIPHSSHMFIGNNKTQREIDLRKGNLTGIDSTKQQIFTDERERPVPDREIWEDVPRIQNMKGQISRINNKYRKVKEKTKGAYLS